MRKIFLFLSIMILFIAWVIYAQVDAWSGELPSFNSNVIGKAISLNWITISNSSSWYSMIDQNLQEVKDQYSFKMIDNGGTTRFSKIVETTTSLPKDFFLSQNYPNPFNPTTQIDYSLPSDSKVTLEVFSIIGIKLAVLVDEYQTAGFYSVNFSSASSDKSISSSVYLYRMNAIDNATGNQFSSMRKMILLK
jgi:hypothetical protein